MTDLSFSLDTELTDLDLSAHIEEPAAQRSEPATNVVALPKVKRKAPQVFAFDYSGISTAVAKEAEATALRIRDRRRAHTIDTGKELLNVKQDLGHGRFGKWLEFHFGWKERTAQNYMNSALAFGSTPQIIDVLPPSTVYKLAAKSTPEALRQSVIEEINRGETPDPKKIEKRIAELKIEARHKGNEPDSAQHDNAGTVPETSKPDSVQAPEDGALTIETSATEDHGIHKAQMPTDARLHELRAKKIAEHLKKRFGANFNILRNEILKTDLAALRKALCEA